MDSKKKAFHRNAMNYEKQSYIPAHIVVHIESELSEPLLQAGWALHIFSVHTFFQIEHQYEASIIPWIRLHILQ